MGRDGLVATGDEDSALSRQSRAPGPPPPPCSQDSWFSKRYLAPTMPNGGEKAFGERGLYEVDGVEMEGGGGLGSRGELCNQYETAL
ncbi:hypothetical protein BaRGS_00021860 [Batillaria attramentaria]|uniref:Uncharacterized protein n=1 Tax=Batillaria attramentaria TaxID=370345 RepID=A0ABD0KI92_9CAEN